MCLNSIASLARTVSESCEMRSLLARAFALVVQVLVDHRLAICSLIVVLKFWRDNVDARRKSFQVRVNLLLQELSSILILPTLPWLLLVVTCCSLSLSVVSLGASVIPPLLRICSFLPKAWAKHVRTRSAWRLQVVDVKPSPVDSWLHDICSDCFPLLHAATMLIVAVGVNRTLLQPLLGGWASALASRREVFACFDVSNVAAASPPLRTLRQVKGALLDVLWL